MYITEDTASYRRKNLEISQWKIVGSDETGICGTYMDAYCDSMKRTYVLNNKLAIKPDDAPRTRLIKELLSDVDIEVDHTIGTRVENHIKSLQKANISHGKILTICNLLGIKKTMTLTLTDKNGEEKTVTGDFD